jgi:hypothetical protein
MTPLETLVMARRAGVQVSVDATTRRLIVEADETPPAEVLEGLRQNRDRLVEMLTLTSPQDPLPGEWHDL